MDQSDSNYEQLIDNNHYDESQLITIKVDMNVPYQTERTEFERVNGEITVYGTVYKYVKRRIYNGQLVLLCIPHHDKTELKSAENKYIGWSSEATKKDEGSSSSKSFSKIASPEYDNQIADL